MSLPSTELRLRWWVFYFTVALHFVVCAALAENYQDTKFLTISGIALFLMIASPVSYSYFTKARECVIGVNASCVVLLGNHIQEPYTTLALAITYVHLFFNATTIKSHCIFYTQPLITAMMFLSTSWINALPATYLTCVLLAFRVYTNYLKTKPRRRSTTLATVLKPPGLHVPSMSDSLESPTSQSESFRRWSWKADMTSITGHELEMSMMRLNATLFGLNLESGRFASDVEEIYKSIKIAQREAMICRIHVQNMIDSDNQSLQENSSEFNIDETVVEALHLLPVQSSLYIASDVPNSFRGDSFYFVVVMYNVCMEYIRRRFRVDSIKVRVFMLRKPAGGQGTLAIDVGDVDESSQELPAYDLETGPMEIVAKLLKLANGRVSKYDDVPYFGLRVQWELHHRGPLSTACVSRQMPLDIKACTDVTFHPHIGWAIHRMLKDCNVCVVPSSANADLTFVTWMPDNAEQKLMSHRLGLILTDAGNYPIRDVWSECERYGNSDIYLDNKETAVLFAPFTRRQFMQMLVSAVTRKEEMKHRNIVREVAKTELEECTAVGDCMVCMPKALAITVLNVLQTLSFLPLHFESKEQSSQCLTLHRSKIRFVIATNEFEGVTSLADGYGIPSLSLNAKPSFERREFLARTFEDLTVPVHPKKLILRMLLRGWITENIISAYLASLRLTVLIADDEPVSSTVMRNILVRLGLNVFFCDCVEDAVLAAQGDLYHAIFLSNTLPSKEKLPQQQNSDNTQNSVNRPKMDHRDTNNIVRCGQQPSVVLVSDSRSESKNQNVMVIPLNKVLFKPLSTKAVIVALLDVLSQKQ